MRIRKILDMSLCFLAIIGLLVVGEYLDVAFIDSQSVTTIDELKNDGLVKEVNDCLPVQRCTENNSVKSANICITKVARVLNTILAFLLAYLTTLLKKTTKYVIITVLTIHHRSSL